MDTYEQAAWTWLSDNGYTYEKSDAQTMHILRHENHTLRLQGSPESLSRAFQNYKIMFHLGKMNNFMQMYPDFVFDLTDVSQWSAIMEAAEFKWLETPYHLLRRLLEQASSSPMHEHSQYLHKALFCNLDEAWLCYRTISVGSEAHLQVTAEQENGANVCIVYRLDQVLKCAGLSELTAQVFGAPWSQEWWDTLRMFMLQKDLNPTQYHIPVEAYPPDM